MTDGSVSASDTPHELLTALRDVTRQVRIAQRGTWLPLLVFAAVTMAAVPVYRFAPRHLGPCRPGPLDTTVCTAVIPLVLVFWPVALVLAYAAIAAFYVQHARARGVGTRIRPYVVAGIGIAALLTTASLWRAFHPRVPSASLQMHLGAPGLTLYDLATPAAAIGLALLVLAWVERSWALLAFSLGYLVVVVSDSARVIHSRSVWWFLPQLLIPAALLLLASAAFALFQPTNEQRSR